MAGPAVFVLVGSFATRASAQAECLLRGMQLATIASQEDQDEVTLLLDEFSFTPRERAWVGATDIVDEGAFVWTDGSALSFEHWAQGEANNNGRLTDCVVLQKVSGGSLEWRDVECDSVYPSVCQTAVKCTGCPAGAVLRQDAGAEATCVACSAGSYSSAGACVECAADSFSAEGAAACSPCAGNSTAPAGSDEASDCKCPAGFSGEDGGPCNVCAAGTFKVGSGSGPCLECPAGTASSAVGAGSNNTCTRCAAGKYAVAGSPKCLACPGGSVSSAGAGSCTSDVAALQSAAIVPGNLSAFLAKEQEYLASYAVASGLDPALVSTLSMEEVRVQGPDGGGRRGFVYYSTVRHTFFLRCTRESLGPILDAFSTGGFQSLLNAVLQAKGYEASDVEQPKTFCGSGRTPGNTTLSQDRCLLCAAGTYKMLADNSSCVACPEYATTAQNGSFLLAQCGCIAGYHSGQGLPFNFSTELTICSEQLEGWGEGGGHYGESLKIKKKDCDVQPYHRKQYSSSESADTWALELDAAFNCSACSAGFYCPEFGTQFPCPLNAWSATGSSARESCVCLAGFTGPDGGSCAQCPRGTFKSTDGSGECSACPAGATSPLGSTVLADCVCDSGYVGEGGVEGCSACPEGTYKKGNGTGDCTPCPAGRWQDKQAAISLAACLACPADTYNPASGAGSLDACRDCPEDTVSMVGSEVCSAHIGALQLNLRINANFTFFDAKKDLYIEAIAKSSGISVKHIELLGATPVSSRRLLFSVNQLTGEFLMKLPDKVLTALVVEFSTTEYATLLGEILIEYGLPGAEILGGFLQCVETPGLIAKEDYAGR